jgi:hypothetical protein
MLKIGFTGTRKGMTEEQKEVFKELIFFELPDEPTEFHHGDCIGADAEAHRIFDDAMESTCCIVTHPPLEDKYAANCNEQDNYLEVRVWIEQGYHKRNDDIITECSEIIACPAENREMQRGSGTWSVIRKTRKAGKKLTIIYPDGTVKQS